MQSSGSLQVGIYQLLRKASGGSGHKLKRWYPAARLNWALECRKTAAARDNLSAADSVHRGRERQFQYFSEYASKPKKLYMVPGASHVNLYDRLNFIPFDKVTSYFSEYLK